MSGKLLLFELPFAQSMAVSAFASRHGLEPVSVSPRDYGRTLGDLAGVHCPIGTGDPSMAGHLLGVPVAVICGLSREEIDRLFGALREEKIPFPAHRAVLTPVNATWTPMKLKKNLDDEIRALGRKE